MGQVPESRMLVPATSLLPGYGVGTASCPCFRSFELSWLACSAEGLMASAYRKPPQRGTSVHPTNPEFGF